ncbi:hypothetical protein JCM6882_001709 [Rhodosporidiobolus microsporus]
MAVFVKPALTCRFLGATPTVAVVGCPFSGGQPKPGVDAGPARLLQSGVTQDIENLGWKVDSADKLVEPPKDDKPDPDIGKLKKSRLVSEYNKNVAARIHSHALKGEFVVSLGGDHSLAMGTVSGVFRAYPDAALIYVDAHADVNSPLTTQSGNLHGCPLSFLLGLPGTSKEELPEFRWVDPVLRPDRLVYIGLRDLDESEKRIIKHYNIKAFTMRDVDRYGISKVVDLALDHVGRERPLHVSFDIDSLDPAVAPSTGVPVEGGLSFREGHYIVGTLAETGNLVALDVMEINPTISVNEGDTERTLRTGRSIIRTALGETLL